MRRATEKTVCTQKHRSKKQRVKTAMKEELRKKHTPNKHRETNTINYYGVQLILVTLLITWVESELHTLWVKNCENNSFDGKHSKNECRRHVQFHGRKRKQQNNNKVTPTKWRLDTSTQDLKRNFPSTKKMINKRMLQLHTEIRNFDRRSLQTKTVDENQGAKHKD